MKINLLNTSHGLFPCTDDDQQNKVKLKIGEVYQATFKKVRNYDFHKKYFALINTAWEYLSETEIERHKTLENFRKSVEVTAGHCDTVYNYNLKSFVDIPKSIAFDKMDNYEFQELYERVRDVIYMMCLRDITKEEFERNLINF